MRDLIKNKLGDPDLLEQMYRENPDLFSSEFRAIYPDLEQTEAVRFWKSRLDYGQAPVKAVGIIKMDVYVLVLVCALSGFLIKLPEIFSIDLEKFPFYEKNAALIVLFGLSLYALRTNMVQSWRKIAVTLLAFIIPAIYINLLPTGNEADAIILAYLHLPLLMWSIYGLVYIDFDLKDLAKRIAFIRYNGDLAILGAIIMISGGILTGISIGLFSAIDIQAETFYTTYVVIIGLVSVPVVATYIVRNYPSLTNKIAPVIAGIFSPLVLITLVIYLLSIMVSGKDPYNDRDFLLVFNGMLLGVMAIIVFSVSETSSGKRQSLNRWILLILTGVTLIIDLVALSAIFYRLGEYGITPNRIAVLGSNLLIFGNLLQIFIDFIRVQLGKSHIDVVERTIARYLPVYTLWTIIVVFGFPLFFGMK
ncbi:MAG: DUF4153 domain-containing protein [Bacteroidales bacterium]|nr:DUF4153 domain-containing protein [Bacteroidales bacterium]